MCDISIDCCRRFEIGRWGRLARLGHTCVSIDFGPASIVYAVRTARDENIRQQGEAESTWSGVERGLFSDRPHFYLEEPFRHTESRTTTTRYAIVDAASGEVTTYASTWH